MEERDKLQEYLDILQEIEKGERDYYVLGDTESKEEIIVNIDILGNNKLLWLNRYLNVAKVISRTEGINLIMKGEEC